MRNTIALHMREPSQSTDRHPYASYSLLDRDGQPFAVVRIGDEHGHEVDLFARDVVTLRRIEEAVNAARLALESSRPLRVNMGAKSA